jgi:predicted ATPase/class 3 adenylate cyclase
MTDVQDSTRHWERSTESMREALRTHDEIAESVFSSFGGVILKERGEGDSLFAAFDSAVSAVRASAEFLQRLANAPWPADPLEVRVGVHAGDVIERDADYYGPSVNRCARIRSIAHGGQILVSETIERLVQDSLGAAIEFRSLGLFRLRDLLRPERIFQVVAPGLRSEFPLPDGLDTCPNNLPVQLTSYIGRAEDIRSGVGLLKRQRLLTLTGPGGSGKTRLALQIAAELCDASSAGTVFVDLTSAGPHEVPDFVCRAVAAVLRQSDSQADPGASIADLPVLLVLDNCEHLVDSAADLCQKLLSGSRNCRILATSRELLQVPGEVSYRVESLSVPAENDADPSSVIRAEAVQLFVDRASLRLSGFAPSDANAADLGAICRELDGMPLAIEHAAGHILSMSPADMRSRLSSRLSLLRSRERGVLPRHATLRATLDWSFETLTQDERVLLPLLTVFRAGWNMESCAAVAVGAGMSPERVEDALNGLVTKSMVSLEGLDSRTAQESGPRRFRLLETTKDYAREKLDADLSLRAFRSALEFFSELACSASAACGTNDEPAWSGRVQLEMHNMLGILSWALENGQIGALAFSDGLRHFWRRFGFVREGANILAAALSAEPDSAGDLVARSWNVLGTLLWSQDRLDEAREAYERSIRTYGVLKDELGTAGVLNNLSLIEVARGDHEKALEFMAKALAIYEAQGNNAKVALVRVNMALQEIEAGRPEAALNRLSEIDARRVLDPGLLVKVHKTAGFAHMRCGSIEEARKRLGGALELWSDSPDLTSLPSLLVFVAAVLGDQLSSVERAQFIGAAEAIAEKSCSDFSEPEAEVRDSVRSGTLEAMSLRQFEKHRLQGASLDPSVLIQKASSRLQLR